MGTRGVIGFRIDDKDKVMYNHMDSYPEYLGVKILEEIDEIISLDVSKTVKKTRINKLKEKVRNIRLIEELEKKLSPLDIEWAKQHGFANFDVGSKEISWYQLLRGMQGDLISCLKHPVMLDAKDFIKDSLFCEWGYIINLDSLELEVWKGFQTEPTDGNRYGEGVSYTCHEGDHYYPCKKVASWPLDELPSEAVMKHLEKLEDEE